MSFHRCSLLVLALVISACASSTGTPFGEGERVAEVSRGGANLITRDELEERSGDSAYEVVEALRRRWLAQNRRGATFGGPPIFARVVVDGTQRGELMDLYRISANEVETLRYISGPDATIKYGTGYLGGAIEVTTRGNRR